MSAACATPLPWEILVDYWAGDLDPSESERIEEHVFSCDSCTARSASVAQIAQALRNALPVIVTRTQVDALRAGGMVIDENAFAAGVPQPVVFPREVDLLVHRLTGLALERADRVHVTVRVSSTGAVLFEDHFAPFDAARGEVLIACQRHFASMPADTVFDVRAHVGEQPPALSTFVIPHEFQ